MNITPALSQRERILTAILYLCTFALIYRFVGGDFDSLLGNNLSDQIILFYSGVLMIVMGSYIVEPFFTKPTDVIANTIAVIVALLGVSDKSAFFLHDALLIYAATLLLLSIFVIAIKDTAHEKLKLISKTTYWLIVRLGGSKVIFSVIYLSASYSYFTTTGNFIDYSTLLAFWVVVVFFDVIGMAVAQFNSLRKLLKNEQGKEVGIAIGCDNPFLYKVEANLQIHKDGGKMSYGDLVAIEHQNNIGLLGMVVDKKHLLSRRHLSVYLFVGTDDKPLTFNLRSQKMISETNTVFNAENRVYKVALEDLDDSIQTLILDSTLFKNKENFAGYIAAGSNINTINFNVLRDLDSSNKNIGEGSILSTQVYGVDTLYQVINGDTRSEHLETSNTHSYILGIARKLGHYDSVSKTLDVVKWMPAAFTPLFYVSEEVLNNQQKRDLASGSIGRLPNTSLSIPIKSVDTIVTHNTAVLGILGIGKSCLTFETIQKVVSGSSSKVICLDITNEYAESLPKYGCTISTLADTTLKAELQTHYADINKDVHRGGNHAYFREGMRTLIASFLASETQRVLVMNPEDYDVSKQTNEVKPKKIGPGKDDWEDQAPMSDLSLVEKTRIISEIILDHVKSGGKSSNAKCLIVFEEAHSLVPEWNSVANKGDEGATNGIAKVILQGRKYGLGCLIVTQRTANVSKSILNQCNTIFALRVFDETGKTFLENYIGRDYADTLSTLEERHAIIIGKSLGLKQPVIAQLNDAQHVMLEVAA